MFVSPVKRALAVIAVSLVAAGVAVAGPPWIAIEYPVNPHDPATRDAFMTVRTYHHGDQVGHELTGTAEGLVNGQRRSMRRTFAGCRSPARTRCAGASRRTETGFSSFPASRKESTWRPRW